jgi:hypothetical protein
VAESAAHCDPTLGGRFGINAGYYGAWPTEVLSGLGPRSTVGKICGVARVGAAGSVQ